MIACFTQIITRMLTELSTQSVSKKSKIVQGWLAFKKHEKHFKHPNFILCEKVVSFPDFYALHLYIINKRAIKKSFEEHNSLFKKILGNSFSPENYLEKLENGHDLSSLLQENDLLLGILLGYGKNSSKAFYERNKKHPGEIEWTKDYRPISGQKQPDVEIYPISFMGDPDSNESRSIIAAYDNELETIWKKYLEKNKDSSLFFLEAFCK